MVSWSFSIFAIVSVPLKQMVSNVLDQAHQHEKIESDYNEDETPGPEGTFNFMY